MDDLGNKQRVSAASRFPENRLMANNPAEIVEAPGEREPSTWKLEIQRKLSDHFWRQLPFAQVIDEIGPRSHDQLAHAATVSLGKIQKWQREIRAFVEAICACSIEYRAEGEEVPAFRQQTVDSRYKLLLASVPPTKTQPRLLTAELMARPLEEVSDTVEKALRRQCASLPDELFQALDALSEIKIVGRIKRLGDTCEINFGRQVIVQAVPSKESWTKSFSTDHSTVEDQYVKTGARVEYRLGHHEHHVMNVREELLDDSTVDVPEQYSPLLETVPIYARPLLFLVEGDLFREVIIERELEVDFLETTVVTRTVREHATAITYDPAIVLGDYVLAGWGSREIRQQEALQRAEHQNMQSEQRRRNSLWFAAASVALIVVGTALLFSSRADSLLSLSPAVLTTLLGVIVAYFSTEHYTQSRQRDDSAWLSFAATIAVASLTLTVQLAIAAFLFKFYWLLGGSLLTFLFFFGTVSIAGDRLLAK